MKSQSLTQTIQVQENQTASQYGSGLLPVYATPALIALMENTAMQLIEPPEGSSSVGISINMQHLKASPIGAEITCKATIISNEGRKYIFKIEATDKLGDLIGECIHERVVVNIEKFLSKIKL
ncbi:MAG: thioesterase family protein [Paludibacter sp.]|nr:thioesterase family protein [Paludibacter sp.]